MGKRNLAQTIRDKALKLGFDSCGIISVEAMEEYAECLEERIQLFPEARPVLAKLLGFAKPHAANEWARSIIVCVYRYGKYKVPAELDGLIGKFNLYDYRFQQYAKEHAQVELFETYLKDLGVRTARESIGVTAGKLAAQKAGLGIIRKNNLFYNQHGSWVGIETWLADQSMECCATDVLPPPCPENCTACIDACPTGALAGPHLLNMSKCVSSLTYGAQDVVSGTVRTQMGKWLYGCDHCQDACPMNKNKWEEQEEYPKLKELTDYIELKRLSEMDEQTWLHNIRPRFWYIGEDRAWLWKTNAIRAMANCFDVSYSKYLEKACQNEHSKVREMAVWACEKVGLTRKCDK